MKEKYRVQAEMAKDNNFDMEKIAEEASKKVMELSKKFNIKIKYRHDMDLKNTA
ncbi:MAG: hypothetical protein PVH61_02040 [Candidatus Aminicenantes bacterium]